MTAFFTDDCKKYPPKPENFSISGRMVSAMKFLSSIEGVGNQLIRSLADLERGSAKMASATGSPSLTSINLNLV